MSAVSTRVATIKSDVNRWARVFSLASPPEESIAAAGRQYRSAVTAKDLGDFYLHTITGR